MAVDGVVAGVDVDDMASLATPLFDLFVDLDGRMVDEEVEDLAHGEDGAAHQQAEVTPNVSCKWRVRETTINSIL